MVRLVLVLLLIGWKNWRESFKPITKRSNRNHVITFDSHLKTALIVLLYCLDWPNMTQTKRVRIILDSFAFQAQFEFALTAVAEEVNAILQALAK